MTKKGIRWMRDSENENDYFLEETEREKMIWTLKYFVISYWLWANLNRVIWCMVNEENISLDRNALFKWFIIAEYIIY